jgi:hypothetical protein
LCSVFTGSSFRVGAIQQQQHHHQQQQQQHPIAAVGAMGSAAETVPS